MADRYQDRPFPSDHDHDRGADPSAESDPLAELARLIGQADPFGAAPPPHPLQSRANVRTQVYQPAQDYQPLQSYQAPPSYQPPRQEDEVPPAGRPSWMQRVRQEAPLQQDYEEPHQEEYQPSPVHPLHRYAVQQSAAPAPAPEVEYREDLPFPEAGHEPDPSRYDDALYGQIESGEQNFQRDPAFPDDPYAYQGAYEDEEAPPRKRSNGLMTVAAVLALAVVGTGAAFAYRTYIGAPRSGGEPPVIKADNSPTKVVPAPSDAVGKTPDRMMAGGDATEKIVSREEKPVDLNARSGPRIAYPPLNQNGSPPSVASVAPSLPLAPAAPNGTLPNNEPRRISTVPIKGDPASAGLLATAPPPATRPAAATPAPRGNPSSANASVNTPPALTPGAPQPEPAPTRVASTSPAPAASTGGGYVVQVSSQKSEADAQASYRSLQGKYPSVLGSQSLVVKRVDLGEKGVYYRAFAGPFGSADQATQVCNSLKAAGGPQCLIQRN